MWSTKSKKKDLKKLVARKFTQKLTQRCCYQGKFNSLSNSQLHDQQSNTLKRALSTQRPLIHVIMPNK